MDKSWMQLTDRFCPEYLKGVETFIEFAWERYNKRGMLLCPCVKCNNMIMRSRDDLHADLVIHGIKTSYTSWYLHGEEYVNDNIGKEDLGDMDGMIRDVCGVFDTDDNDEDFEVNTEPLGEAKKFFELLEDARQEVYPGCKGYSKLSFIVKLLHIKVLNGWSNKSFTMLLELIKKILPEGETLPESYYKCKKYIRDLGLGYDKIHACPNDCMLFWKENKYRNSCVVCGASRWKSGGESNDVGSSSLSNQSKVASKILRYFPLRPRLQRLFMSAKTAEAMIWHDRDRVKDELIRHPADSRAWKHFDTCHPLFSSESRNVRLALATDGFNPFGSLSSSYTTWPIVLVPYNLPPWMCMKQSFTMLTLLIPGPKAPGNDIDVYLQPLIEELKELWDVGVKTYDAFSKQNFQLKAAIMWTVNDFPAYANLSGWSTKGKLACPCCNVNTESMWLKFGGKHSYMGHRMWLPDNHKWRNNQVSFNDKVEFRTAPTVLSGDDIIAELCNIDEIIFGKSVEQGKRDKPISKGTRKRKRDQSREKSGVKTNWKKRSIFFELPYWRTHLIRHNLDVMHIEKNVCESLVGTLLDIELKSKDNVKSRQDLEVMGIRKDLHLKKVEGSERLLMPAACFTMSNKEKDSFYNFLNKVKVPDGYSSNIARCAQLKERKLVGMKSHDYHVLIQRLLPLGMRGLLPREVYSPLFELSNFFSELCSKTLTIEGLQQLQSQIAITLCKLEMIFPPSFFDVMVHLLVHLAEEAMIAGPVQYRWNYFVERNLHTLKSYVRNKSRPEGSIAEGYLAEECLTFCSRYLNDIETKFNRPVRNDDYHATSLESNTLSVLSVFKQNGRPLGKGFSRELSQEEFEQARSYVLQNCYEVNQYIEEHKKLVPDERLHKSLFPEWFEQRVTQMHNSTATISVSEQLLSLARGPRRSITYFNGYIMNGFRFHTEDRERQRKTQNSGVRVAGVDEVEYYGVLTDVIELQYNEGRRVVLFKCDWWDVFNKRNGISTDMYGFKSVNFSKKLNTTEPFVLACQAEQVFYVEDNLKVGWHIVVKTKPRDLYNMCSDGKSAEPVDDGEPLQNDFSDFEFVHLGDQEDHICWTRDDVDQSIVDV